MSISSLALLNDRLIVNLNTTTCENVSIVIDFFEPTRLFLSLRENDIEYYGSINASRKKFHGIERALLIFN